MNAKRLISWILTIAILLGLAATGAVAAFAAETTVIDTVEATVLNVAEGKDTSGVSVTVPAGANYEVEIDGIHKETLASVSPFTGTFGKECYSVYVLFTPKDGYSFLDTDIDCTVGGDNIFKYNVPIREPDMVMACVYYAFGTPIREAELTVTGMEKGKSAKDVKVTVPTGANYTLESFQILDSNDDPFTGTFDAGRFTVAATLAPAEGYYLDHDLEVTFNGEEADYAYLGSAGEYLELEHRFDMRTPIDKVAVTVTGMEKGKSTTDVKVTVPADAKYSVGTYGIYDYEWEPYTGSFEQNHYTADIYLVPAEGYCFTDDTQATVNGTEPDYLNAYDSGLKLNMEYYLDLRTPITKVEITAPDLKSGMDTTGLKPTIPADANYIVDIFRVVDDNYNPVTGKLTGSCYSYDISLIAKPGCYFSDNVVVTFNGGTDAEYYLYDNNTLMEVNKEYFMGKYITKVELPAWPATPKVGDSAPASAPTSVPGKGYRYYGVWGNSSSPVGPDDKFASDTTYQYQYLAAADEGYRFADNVTVTVGGKSYTGLVMSEEDMFAIVKVYPLGNAKVINKIVLSGEAPTAGKAPGTVTSSGTGYTLGEYMWGVSNKGNGTGVHNPGETFQVGEYVYLGLEIIPEKGYTLDYNAQVLFNGKSYKLVPELMVSSPNGTPSIVICLGQLKAASNPGTGDETPVVLLTGLTLASILGMGLILNRRKSV